MHRQRVDELSRNVCVAMMGPWYFPYFHRHNFSLRFYLKKKEKKKMVEL